MSVSHKKDKKAPRVPAPVALEEALAAPEQMLAPAVDEPVSADPLAVVPDVVVPATPDVRALLPAELERLRPERLHALLSMARAWANADDKLAQKQADRDAARAAAE